MRLLCILHFVAGVTVALPTSRSQEHSDRANAEAGFHVDELAVPVATGVAVTLANEIAKGAYKYVRGGLQKGTQFLSWNKQPLRSRRQWTEDDKSRCVTEMLFYLPHSIRPEDDEVLYRLYESYMRTQDATLSMKVSYPELLLEAICSSGQAMLEGKPRLMARWQIQKDDSRLHFADTSGSDTLKRVGTSLRSKSGAATGGGILTAPLLKGMPAPVLVPL